MARSIPRSRSTQALALLLVILAGLALYAWAVPRTPAVVRPAAELSTP